MSNLFFGIYLFSTNSKKEQKGKRFRAMELLPLPRGALHDLVHTEDGFGSFGGGDEDVALQLQRLEDAEFLHVPDTPLVHVCGGVDERGHRR